MKGFEYAKLHGMTNAEVKEKFGIASHLSVIPESLLEEAPTIVSGAWDENIEEEIIEETVEQPKEVPATDDCPVSLEVLELSIRSMYNKSPYFKWKHLLEK